MIQFILSNEIPLGILAKMYFHTFGYFFVFFSPQDSHEFVSYPLQPDTDFEYDKIFHKQYVAMGQVSIFVYF